MKSSIFAGESVLDLSKILIYNFHFESYYTKME